MKKREDDNSEFDVIKYLKESNFLNDSMKETKKRIEKKGFVSEYEDMFFVLKMDKDGSPSVAYIKFLPSKIDPVKIKKGEKPVNILIIFKHYFRMRNGDIFNEICPTTIRKPCPVCTAIAPLWNDNAEDKKKYQRMSRNKYFYTNVFIIKNPDEPEYEKSVKLMRLYADLVNMIMQRYPKKNDMLGKRDERTGELYFDPFDPFGSPVFKLKGFMEKTDIGGRMKNVPNFSGSTFQDEIKPLSEKLYRQLHKKSIDLYDILKWDENKIKSFEELSQKFNSGMSGKLTMDFGSEQGKTPFDGDSIEKDIDKINDSFDDKQLKEDLKDSGLEFDDDIEITDKKETDNNDDDIDIESMMEDKSDNENIEDDDDIDIESYLDEKE